MTKVQFGMKVVKYNQSSFERQIRESVTIQSERQDHILLNSRTEYNRCSLPRLCTQVGEGEYKNYSEQLDLEKKEEEKIESRIRQLRKERNKARMYPTREGDKKRRKLNSEEYIRIDRIWGEPEITKQAKNKLEHENNPSKRTKTQDNWPPRGSPSPGKQPDGEQEDSKEYSVGENYDGPTDWEEQIEEHKNQIVQEEQTAQNLVEKENNSESSWELMKLCREYLEENSSEWAKRREQRQNEKNRLERLEKAGILSRKAKMRELENNIEKGFEKLPRNEQEKIKQKEKRKKLLELKEAKEDLWKLKGREKKIVNQTTLQKIKELGRKAQQIRDILENEKKKLAEEKKKQEEQENIRRSREQKRKETLEKKKKLEERWAMYRWVVEYMQENSVHWEKRRKEIEQERERKLEEWEKKKRFEKIAFLEKKWLDKKQGVENENEKIQNNMQPEEKKWTVWRENKGENIVTPSKPSPQEISFPRKSPPSEKQTPSDLTKSPLHSPSPSPKKVPPTPAGGKLKQEIKNIEKENLHKPSTTQTTIESFIAKQTDRQSNKKTD